ncbi:unnamed protein product [Bursaphelenchus okinawaensis]|uniref:BED-type domain-containing protein n=1 Tax=Bursaphelenchus okinawaensis TaxID=465554 RepID=A0A811KQW4_9BILA|nr:unnamed protein product [Bursaphelenchus okinawaensis]CAG9112074.1 unnamed protein product [Bursaphelenchus okinawaensis]
MMDSEELRNLMTPHLFLNSLNNPDNPTFDTNPLSLLPPANLLNFPFLFQQLNNHLTSPPTPPQPATQSSHKSSADAKFHGRHSIWRHFKVQRELNVYKCEVGLCTATYTWPPSTTVAGRHLRDKHPEVYNQVLNEETERRNRKRAAECSKDGECHSPPTSTHSSSDLTHVSDLNQSSLDLPSPQVFSPDSIKRLKYDDDLLSRLSQQFLHDQVQVINPIGLDYMLCKQESEDDKREKVMSADYEWPAKKPSVDPALICEIDRLREQETAQKMKIQKMTENLNDFKEDIENLRARNDLLEKKGATVDDEIGVFQAKLNQLEAEKSKVEQQLKEATVNLNKKSAELHEVKEQNSELRNQVSRTKRELSEFADDQTRTASESELSQLKKSKRDLEQKLAELEDELDEVVSKNELLEQNVTRLNLAMERMKNENSREANSREEELNELRSQHQRRVRTYEEQIVDLSENYNNVQRQLKQMEQKSRLFETTHSTYSFETQSSNNYKREYKKTAAMLKDTQNLLAMERQKSDKALLIKKLRAQLDEAEEGKMAAVRSKFSLENELSELNLEIDTLKGAKKVLEEKNRDLFNEKSHVISASKDLEEQLATVLRDYRNAVLQTEADSRLITQQSQMIAELESNKQELTQQLAEAQSQVAYLKSHFVEGHKLTVLERSLVDVKSRLEYEKAEKVKYETSANRLQDEVDRMEDQINELQRTVSRQQEVVIKHKRELANEAEVNRELKKREEEMSNKYKKSRDEMDQIQSEHAQTSSDLTLALRRIDALQAALNANSDVEEDDDRDDFTDEETEADGPSESLELNDSDATKVEETSENGKHEQAQPITA